MDGTVTRNMANCLAPIVERVCGFNVEDSVEAQTAKNILGSLAEIANNFVSSITVNGVKIEFTREKVEQIFDQVITAAANGSCVALTDLQGAIVFIDGLLAQASSKKAMALKAVSYPDLYSLKIRAGLIK